MHRWLSLLMLLVACAPEGERPASLTSALTVGGCECVKWSSGVACEALSYSDVPADGMYYVTTFGGPGDSQDMWICGHKTTDNGSWPYAAGYARFGCGKIRIEHPQNGLYCIAEVADCGPNRCVEEAASFSGCKDHFPIVDVSPFITKHLFGITSSGWSEKRLVKVSVVDSSTPIGCGAPGSLTLKLRPLPIPGQAADFRPEGSSAEVFDLYEGQEVDFEVTVTNDSSFSTPGQVKVSYAISSPWLAAATGPAMGDLDAGVLGPNESRVLKLRVLAAAYSIGVPSPPVVHASVGDKAAMVRVDVWSRTRFEFEGDTTEGWTLEGASLQVTMQGGSLSLAATSPGVRLVGPATDFDTDGFDAVLVRVKSLDGDRQARFYFETDQGPDEAHSVEFTIPGDGSFHDLTIPGVSVWSASVTRMSILFPSAGRYMFDRILLIAAGQGPKPIPDAAQPDAASDLGQDAFADHGTPPDAASDLGPQAAADQGAQPDQAAEVHTTGPTSSGGCQSGHGGGFAVLSLVFLAFWHPCTRKEVTP